MAGSWFSLLPALVASGISFGFLEVHPIVQVPGRLRQPGLRFTCSLPLLSSSSELSELDKAGAVYGSLGDILISIFEFLLLETL